MRGRVLAASDVLRRRSSSIAWSVRSVGPRVGWRFAGIVGLRAPARRDFLIRRLVSCALSLGILLLVRLRVGERVGGGGGSRDLLIARLRLGWVGCSFRDTAACRCTGL